MKDNKTNIESYIWKMQDGTEKRLVDMPYDSLQQAYYHCTDMLWNTSPSSLGRTKVKENIKNAEKACNTELFLRMLLHDDPIKRFKTNRDVLEYIKVIKKECNYSNSDSVSNIFNGVSDIYSDITIDMLMDACFDKLDPINRKMLSDKFIFSQGIWLTEEEKNDLTEIDETTGERRPYMEIIKERLALPNVRLKVDPKGFSFAEFRALMKMAPMTKISSLTTITLKLLRDKVLLLLDADVDKSIARWTELMKQIEEVADYKHFMMKRKSY